MCVMVESCRTPWTVGKKIRPLVCLLPFGEVCLRVSQFSTAFLPSRFSSGLYTFNRKGEKVGVSKSGFSCATDSTRDWRSLINDPNAVKISK